MQTKCLHLIVVCCFLGFLTTKTVALNYIITFTGSGAANTVGDVIVQNLTQKTSVTVPAGNVLDLSDAATDVGQVGANTETIHVYPASVSGKYVLAFFTKQAGLTQIKILNLNGTKVAGININLQTGNNSFELSLPKGISVIQVTGNEYIYTAKMLNPAGTQGKPNIAYTGTEKPALSGLHKITSQGTTSLQYTAGDQLLYKAISGNYSTIITDVPTSSKTMNFNFVACTDANGNNYTVVTIGSQTWMAENLKTTQYNDGTAIPVITDNTSTWGNLTTPAYCWYNNDAATYKNMYGALYNWHAVHTGRLAPLGWHVPTDGEWTTLENYLTANGYNYDGSTSGNYCAKSLASNTNWVIDTTTGAVSNDLSKNNRTGFSAQPGGYRYNDADGAGQFTYWWSSAENDPNNAWNRHLNYYGNNLHPGYSGKSSGFSVRCVKDN
jgi:Uncharacterized protein conserved in bacteria